MFIPNTTALLLRRSGRDLFGKASFALPVPIPCATVDMVEDTVPTPVRGDTSASHGAAQIDTLQAKILVPASVSIKKYDVLRLLGKDIEVTAITPRLDLIGHLDHFEISGNLKGNL